MSERGSYAKGRAKRDKIVEVALDLFAKKGYDRTSVREIARLTGLSQAGLLHHFKSKEELFLEVLRRRDDRNEREYDENKGHPVSLPGLVEVVRHNAEEPGLVRLYVTMSAESTALDSPARQFFTERYDRLLADVAVDIRRQQDLGKIHPSLDPDAIASLMIAAADGLQLQWLLRPEGFDMGERLELLSEVLHGFVPTAGESA
jgi:AcrR family transcriptional regulator